MSDFDREISDLLSLQQKPLVPALDSEIQSILNRVRSKPIPQPTPEIQDDDKRINSLLLDIEKEFQDLDDILKEVDEVVKS